MTAVDSRGAVLNLDNDEAEKLMKILRDWPKLNLGTPGERASDEVNDVSELSSGIEKLENNLVCYCKAICSFVKQSRANFEAIPKMMNAERRNGENCFFLLNERISNIKRFAMNKIMEHYGVMRKKHHQTIMEKVVRILTIQLQILR